MKIDVTQPILDARGKPLPVGKKSDEVWTLAAIFTEALDGVAVRDDGRPEVVPRQEKDARFWLSVRVVKAEATGELLTLSVDEAAKLKDLVDKFFPNPVVYARVNQAIEAAAAGDKDETAKDEPATEQSSARRSRSNGASAQPKE